MKLNFLLAFLALFLAIEGAPNRFYGVNVGGVFLLERFINPSFITFQNGIVDEWTYSKFARDNNNVQMINQLKDHWMTFITDSDLETAAKAGITHLRIAIPYWSVATDDELKAEGEPYFTGQWPAIENLLMRSKKYGLKSILDLHSVPGSQNGFDNSGRSGDLNWGKGNTMERTLVYLERICQRVKAMETNETLVNTVVGIELVNEAYTPKLTGGMATLKKYYLDAYPIVRKYLPAENYFIVIEMGFDANAWNNFMAPPDYQNVILDLHIYQCFDAGLRQAPYNTHLQIACENAPSDIVIKQTLPSIVGEWSAAYKVDSAYADTEEYPNSNDQIAFMKNYVLAQMKSYEINPSFGWFYWTLKTEHAPMWDFLVGMKGGWVPTAYPQPALMQSCNAYPNSPTPKSLAFPTVSNISFVPSTLPISTSSTSTLSPSSSSSPILSSSPTKDSTSTSVQSSLDNEATLPSNPSISTETLANESNSLSFSLPLLLLLFIALLK